MNKFLFILSSSVLSGLLSGSVLAILNALRTRGHSDHPHQILPTWMILFVIGFIFAASITLVWSMYYVLYKGETNPDLLKTVLITAGIGASIAGFLAVL
jgi:tellurite resistance protein TehA-like permease